MNIHSVHFLYSDDSASSATLHNRLPTGKAPLEKDTFRPSAPSAEKSPERRLISGCPVKSGDRHIDRLIAQTNILQLTFPANSPDMNHSRRTQHAAQCLEVAALHHLMCAEISLQQHVNFHFRQFG